MQRTPGNLFVLSAPSGAGKSSLIKAMLEQDKQGSMAVSVSHTTRQPRPGEINGVHYHFVDHKTFESLVAENAMFEWAEVFGQYYGTSHRAIEDTLQQGKDVFLDIDWQGARQVKKMKSDAITVFIAPPSREALLSRLRGRGQDSDEVIASRMKEAISEISHFSEFDYIVVNDDFELALQELKSILIGHRLTQDKQSMRHQGLFHSLLQE